MTKNDFLRIARTQGLVGDRRECYVNDVIDLLNFAQLVAAQAAEEEREACARMADEYATWGGSNFYDWFKKLATAIRARGTA